jgi:hypothetical protein
MNYGLREVFRKVIVNVYPRTGRHVWEARSQISESLNVGPGDNLKTKHCKGTLPGTDEEQYKTVNHLMNEDQFLRLTRKGNFAQKTQNA